jgi:hypothetical protein
MNKDQNRRRAFILVSAFDTLLSGFILLIYFGFLTVDISSLGVKRWAIGLIGGLWFVASLAILTYQLTRTDVE